MRGYLIDTNVLSEIRKGESRGESCVLEWWSGMHDQELYLSVVTLGEIRKGIDRLVVRDPFQALVLERWLGQITNSFQERLIEISPSIADRWGKLQATRALPEVDALLAASALEHELVLVTRNENDFSGLDVQIVNPFAPHTP